MKHTRDISDADLEVAIASQGNSELLRQLVDLARATFGFYPSYFPYTLNYPWVAERIGRLSVGSRVLDIGAGVSPLPLYLAGKGIHVDCVDNSRHVRALPATPDWNEWGYLDYGALHQNLTAYHCDISGFEPVRSFDAIYSVAAFAHMKRATRDIVFQRCRQWLKARGTLLLTIDVIPATDFIWNRCEGLEVESPIQHGTLSDVLGGLEQVGFKIDESKAMRTVYKSRTDLLFINCVKREGVEAVVG